MSDSRSPGDPLSSRVSRFLRREGKRVGVGIVGGIIVIVGIALMPLPGPGMLVVLAGLAVLATQFAWAQDLLDRARHRAREAIGRLRGESEDGGSGGNGDPSSNGTHLDPGAIGGRSDVA